jgi:hypothetical protein
MMEEQMKAILRQGEGYKENLMIRDIVGDLYKWTYNMVDTRTQDINGLTI